MTTPSDQESGNTDTQPSSPLEKTPYEEGKRAGAHPLVVVLGMILGLWFMLWLYIPSSKDKRATNPEPVPIPYAEEAGEGSVMFHVKGSLPELNVIIAIVPPEATTSQVAGLLNRFRKARLENSLSSLLPPTTLGHKLGDHSVAEIYVFSNTQYAVPEAVSVLARGAHAPGDLYPQAIPFEVAMEHVRGHYRIDMNDTGHPDRASIGFADESGVHSKTYRPLF